MSLRSVGWVAAILLVVGTILFADRRYSPEVTGIGCGLIAGGVTAFLLAFARLARQIKRRRTQTDHLLDQELRAAQRGPSGGNDKGIPRADE